MLTGRALQDGLSGTTLGHLEGSCRWRIDKTGQRYAGHAASPPHTMRSGTDRTSRHNLGAFSHLHRHAVLWDCNMQDACILSGHVEARLWIWALLQHLTCFVIDIQVPGQCGQESRIVVPTNPRVLLFGISGWKVIEQACLYFLACAKASR
jgi:hypothetical protein